MRWHQKSGWIIFFLIVFFPVGIFLTWKYSSWKRTPKIIVSVIFGFLFVIGFISNIASHGSTLTPQGSMLTSSGSASVTENSNATNNFANEPLTTDHVKNAISNFTVKNKITSVKISGSTVTVIVYDKDNWNAKSYLELNQQNSAGIFHDVFSNKKISSVVYQSDVNVTDAYGKSTRVTAQTNTMKRADAEKVDNWGTFSTELPAQFYSVVNFELAPESKVGGLHAAWVQYYK